MVGGVGLWELPGWLLTMLLTLACGKCAWMRRKLDGAYGVSQYSVEPWRVVLPVFAGVLKGFAFSLAWLAWRGARS